MPAVSRPRVKDLQDALKAEKDARALDLFALDEANKRADELAVALAQRTDKLADARAQIAALLAAPPAPANPAPAYNGPKIPRPTVPKGKSMNIQREMDVDDRVFQQIRYFIRRHAGSVGLDWTKDFRRQPAHKLSIIFRAASKKFRVLKKYEDDWATAAILARYMQNVRKYSRKLGYLPKKARFNAGNKENAPAGHGADSDDDVDGSSSEGESQDDE